jgi:hypothetical protein
MGILTVNCFLFLKQDCDKNPSVLLQHDEEEPKKGKLFLGKAEEKWKQTKPVLSFVNKKSC